MKNTTSAIILTFALSTEIWACSNKIDPSKVILFIDTNYSDLEIQTAEKAACQRGENLVVVPKNYKAYTDKIKQFEKAARAVGSCTSNCTALEEAATQAHQNLQAFSDSQPDIRSQLEDQLMELIDKKAKIQNITISGHNGGGSFGGFKGNLDKSDLGMMLGNAPEINEVQSVMLLGCYTGVQKEINDWKTMFPKIRMIGGYDGSAPLSDKLAGHTYLEDLLSKEKKILQQADEKKIHNFITRNVRHFGMLEAGLYINPVCEEKGPEDTKGFYYSSENKAKKFTEFDVSECYKMDDELSRMSELYRKYDDGELEPPQDPSTGELRQLYDRARSIEHCLEIRESEIYVNNLFNLRFYSAVKTNFARHYKKDLELVEKMMNEIKSEDLIKELQTKAESLNIDIPAKEEEIKQAQIDPTTYLKNRDLELEQFQAAKDKLLSNPETLNLYNDFMNPNIGRQLSEDQYKIIQELQNLDRSILVVNYKKSIPGAVEQQELLSMKEEAFKYDNQLANLKAGKKPFDIWIPTEANLKKKTRKETISNMHEIEGILQKGLLNGRQTAALEWTNQVQEEHLKFFSNPFSWHEVTSRTEPPENYGEIIDLEVRLRNADD